VLWKNSSKEDVRCVVLFNVLAYGENQKFQPCAVIHIHDRWVVLSYFGGGISEDP
jgi:hypothetical protein